MELWNFGTLELAMTHLSTPCGLGLGFRNPVFADGEPSGSESVFHIPKAHLPTAATR
jgi:hypothetical protein